MSTVYRLGRPLFDETPRLKTTRTTMKAAPRSIKRADFLCSIGVSLGVLTCLPARAADLIERIKGPFVATIYAADLKSPDGLAFHPISGELYVVEETGMDVKIVREGRVQAGLKKGWTVLPDIPKWAIKAEKTLDFWLLNRLRSPEGIAFSKQGHMFITEDVPDGRLLEFIPNEQGEYDTARALPIPWLEKQYEWESVIVARDGRIFLAGSSSSYGPGLFFGSVLMRDVEEVWWAVDYSPFASFSSLALSRDQDILVVGEEFPGAVTWWDTDRQKDIAGIEKKVPNVEGLCVMPDGGILIVQESNHREKKKDLMESSLPASRNTSGGRLLRLNPESRDMQVLAEGFGTLESVAISPETGYIYVTEDSSGQVIEMRPTQNLLANEYLLKRSMQEFEIMHGYAPKGWPGFLKPFMSDLGIQTRDPLEETDQENLMENQKRK